MDRCPSNRWWIFAGVHVSQQVQSGFVQQCAMVTPLDEIRQPLNREFSGVPGAATSFDHGTCNLIGSYVSFGQNIGDMED